MDITKLIQKKIEYAKKDAVDSLAWTVERVKSIENNLFGTGTPDEILNCQRRFGELAKILNEIRGLEQALEIVKFEIE